MRIVDGSNLSKFSIFSYNFIYCAGGYTRPHGGPGDQYRAWSGSDGNEDVEGNFSSSESRI